MYIVYIRSARFFEQCIFPSYHRSELFVTFEKCFIYFFISLAIKTRIDMLEMTL